MTPQPTSDQDQRLAATPTRLLDVAERLFAEHGIGSVSLRQIVLASGQGNLSAAHYHFGTREGLIRRLLERRMIDVDALRHRRLDHLVTEGRDRDVQAIVGCAVGTLVEVLLTRTWGADYLRVGAQALFNRRIDLLQTLDPRALSGLTRMMAMLRAVMPPLSQDEFELRMDILRHETVYAFDRWLQRHGRPTRADEGGLKQMASGVVAMMSHALQAPAGYGSSSAGGRAP